jgi:pimeloyl-ACP methyl ester carboxylesterase
VTRPLLLIHGYSADGLDFAPLAKALAGVLKCELTEVNIGNYVSLNNEITIKDIAEGLDRAFGAHPALKNAAEFDAIVHSTGMLVIRSWLTNYGAAVGSNKRLAQLKHLIGVAPATWGSPQAHKGRTWLGALVKGNKTPGPDFLNAGDKVLDGLELGSRFTWDLSAIDLVGPAPYYSKGESTPYVAVFIGNQPYDGLASVANDPGTDGTVRWSGCGLNTRKITIDLTQTPIGPDGKPAARTRMTPWAGDRLDIPIIAVEGRNHGTLISNPEPGMVQLIADYLSVGNAADHDKWLATAQAYGAPAKQKRLVNPGKGAAGVVGEAKTFFGHLLHLAEEEMEGWQQFVVRARDERGDPVTDYMIQVLRKDENNNWVDFEEMYTDVHAYAADPSYRCFHIRLPKGICGGQVPLRVRIQASTGTDLMAYQGYGSDDVEKDMGPTAKPVEIDLGGLGNDSLFHPFTTTMVEIVLNRLPSPLNEVSKIFTFLASLKK